MSNCEDISHKTYTQGNNIRVASAKQVFNKRDISTTKICMSFSKCILCQMDYFCNQVKQIKISATTVHTFQFPPNILSLVHVSLGYWGLHSFP